MYIRSVYLVFFTKPRDSREGRGIFLLIIFYYDSLLCPTRRTVQLVIIFVFITNLNNYIPSRPVAGGEAFFNYNNLFIMTACFVLHVGRCSVNDIFNPFNLLIRIATPHSQRENATLCYL